MPAVSADRASDVLDRVLARALEACADLAADLVVDGFRDADAAGLRQSLEARDNIDAIAQNVLSIDDDVAEIDPDAVLDAPVFGITGLVDGHRLLHGERAPDRVNDAWEFDQQAVPGRLDDAPAELSYPGVDQFPAEGLMSRNRAFLVQADQPRIANHVGHENGGEPADDLFGHVTPPHLGPGRD